MSLQISHIKESVTKQEANRRIAILREWEEKTRERPEEEMRFAIVSDSTDAPGWTHIDAYDAKGELLGHVWNFGAVDWRAALERTEPETGNGTLLPLPKYIVRD